MICKGEGSTGRCRVEKQKQNATQAGPRVLAILRVAARIEQLREERTRSFGRKEKSTLDWLDAPINGRMIGMKRRDAMRC